MWPAGAGVVYAANPPPLVSLLEAAVSQHQSIRAQWDQLELVLDLGTGLGLVDECTATQVHLQLRQQVTSTPVALVESRDVQSYAPLASSNWIPSTCVSLTSRTSFLTMNSCLLHCPSHFLLHR